MTCAALNLVTSVLEGKSAREFIKGLPTPPTDVRRFVYIFDFGAGGGEYMFYLELNEEMVKGLEDEDLENFLLEYGQENIEHNRIPKDDWKWCVAVDEVPVKNDHIDWYHGSNRLGEAGPAKAFFKRLGARKLLKVGETVSHATLNSKDLLCAWLEKLKELDPGAHTRIVNECDVEDYMQDNQTDGEIDNLLYEVLSPALQKLCPPLTYFGSHPGCSSDIGCWPYDASEYEDMAAEGRILYASQGSELAERIRAGFEGNPEAQGIDYGIIEIGYYSYECCDSHGKPLWAF